MYTVFLMDWQDAWRRETKTLVTDDVADAKAEAERLTRGTYHAIVRNARGAIVFWTD